MNKSYPPTEKQILNRMQIAQRNVFVLGSFASRLTFSAQQTRAFNLIWALYKSSIIKPKSRIGIVGGGLAGITAAAAAVRKGYNVTLIERSSEILSLQRGNYTRYIHPNILQWPHDDAEKEETILPALNWKADTLDKVILQIEEGWNEFRELVEVHNNQHVRSIKYHEGKIRILTDPVGNIDQVGINKKFDCVILAVGFGLERNLDKIGFRSYWANDSLHQEIQITKKPKHYLVTGCGDGGLIDALRLCIKNFDHKNFVEEILSDGDLKDVKKELIAIEEESAKESSENVDSFLLNAYRERLKVPQSVKRKLLLSLRKDVKLTLNGPGLGPVIKRSSILNRFAVFLLWEYEAIAYQQGRVMQTAGKPDNYRVNFQMHNGRGVVLEFNEIIVRHGPEPVIKNFLSKKTLKRFQNVWKSLDDPTINQNWKNNFFEKNTKGVSIHFNPEQRAKMKMEDALSQLFADQLIGVRIEEINGEIGYIVTSAREIPESDQLKEVCGFPVVYEKPFPPNQRPDEVLPGSRVLHIGSRIYAHDVHGGQQLVTLGGFVFSDEGSIRILSTAHGILAYGRKIGDKMYNWISREEKKNPLIGNLHSYVELQPSFSPLDPAIRKRVMNIMDVSLTDIKPGVEYVPNFPDQLSLPPIEGTGDPRRGDRVFKVGGLTGLTYGTVISESATIALNNRGISFWMRNSFVIMGDGNTRFSREGDSGSLVITESPDGKCLAIGMVFGTDRLRTYAFPIEPALEALNCKLLLFKADV